jgi:hypothetical protein
MDLHLLSNQENDMERASRGWIYVMGKDSELLEDVKERLNKRGFNICEPERDVRESDEREAHRIAVKCAVAVVVLATKDLYRDPFCRELLNLPTPGFKLPRVLVVSADPKTDPEELYALHEWRISARFEAPTDRRRLIDGISRRLKRLVGSVAFSGGRKPQGRRGVYAFISYSAKNTPSKQRLSDQLERLGLKVWDYGKNPRNPDGHYRREIDDAIKDARHFLILHTAAWDGSEECRHECSIARKEGKDPVWLCVGRTSSPPKRKKGEPCIDMRAHCRNAGYRELENLLFPRRRTSRL